MVQLPMLACGEREAMVMVPPLHVTQQYRLASMVAWLSSTGISHHDLLPIPSIHLSIVNSSPRPGIAPQPLNSSSQPLRLPGDLHPCLGHVWLWQRLSDSHSIYAVTDQLTLSHKCFSSDSDNCPNAGIRLLLQFPHQPGAGPINTCFSP